MHTEICMSLILKVNQAFGPINLMDKTRDEFNPTSLAIDEENNDIFIGNTTEARWTGFSEKINIW